LNRHDREGRGILSPFTVVVESLAGVIHLTILCSVSTTNLQFSEFIDSKDLVSELDKKTSPPQLDKNNLLRDNTFH